MVRVIHPGSTSLLLNTGPDPGFKLNPDPELSSGVRQERGPVIGGLVFTVLGLAHDIEGVIHLFKGGVPYV